MVEDESVESVETAEEEEQEHVEAPSDEEGLLTEMITIKNITIPRGERPEAVILKYLGKTGMYYYQDLTDFMKKYGFASPQANYFTKKLLGAYESYALANNSNEPDWDKFVGAYSTNITLDENERRRVAKVMDERRILDIKKRQALQAAAPAPAPQPTQKELKSQVTQQTPSTMSSYENEGRYKRALRIILEKLPGISPADRANVLDLFEINKTSYETNWAALQQFIQNTLGRRSVAVTNMLLTYVGGQQSRNAEAGPLLAGGGGLIDMNKDIDPNTGVSTYTAPSFNSAMMPPGMGMGGMQGMPPGMLAGMPPEMAAQMQQQMYMEYWQEMKREKMMKEMVNAMMFNAMKSANSPEKGGNDLMQLLPLLGGNVRVHTDENGKQVIEMTKGNQQADSNTNQMLQFMTQMNQTLMTAVIGNKAGGENLKEYKDMMKEFAQIKNPDSLEQLSKMRQALPELFTPQHSSMEERRLEVESNLAAMDKRFSFERLKWDRNDKVEDRRLQQSNMKSYMDGLGELATKVFAPIVDKIAGGVSNGLGQQLAGFTGQQQQPQPQQQAQPNPQVQAAEMLKKLQTIDFSKLSDAELEFYKNDFGQAQRSIADRANLINTKGSQLEMELQRRAATKAAQQASTNAAVHEAESRSPPQMIQQPQPAVVQQPQPVQRGLGDMSRGLTTEDYVPDSIEDNFGVSGVKPIEPVEQKKEQEQPQTQEVTETVEEEGDVEYDDDPDPADLDADMGLTEEDGVGEEETNPSP